MAVRVCHRTKVCKRKLVCLFVNKIVGEGGGSVQMKRFKTYINDNQQVSVYETGGAEHFNHFG